MAKVFRLFEDKDLQHWQDRGEAYGPIVIEKILNPDGDLSKKEPTSIPSPFARIDLVRTAFKYVVDKDQMDGQTIYHKLISDCLDLGEMLFKIDSLGSRAQIKFWDKNVDLNKLKKSANPKHKLYGETLELYLNQDKTSYNFDLLDKMYFVLYNHQIIGGTSPSTLFFTSANDLSTTGIKFGHKTLFDHNFLPLYKRDPEYQKYLHHLFKANPILTTRMRELSAYLAKNLNLLMNSNNDLYDAIMQQESEAAEDLLQELNSIYKSLDTGTEGDNLEVIGCALKKKNIQDRGSFIEANSAFTIKSAKYLGGHKPLALQNNFSQKLSYTGPTVLWESTTKVPYADAKDDLNERVLPGQLDKYPYLTVSDFLQPRIIRLGYPLNKDKFWNGNLRVENGDKNKHFILPLKKRFFDFFDTTDLQRQMPDGKPMFEMAVYAGSVDVTLRIPIKDSNYVTFKRSYDAKNEPDIENNHGTIIENQFSLAIYPFVKTGSDEDSFYRVLLLDRDIDKTTKHYNYDLSFGKNLSNQSVEPKDKKSRSNKISDNVNTSTTFFILENEFDYVEVRHNDASGIVIPLFREVGNGSEVFTFAVDFGTTNTHIEYRIGNGDPKPLEITADDMQFAILMSPDVKDDRGTYTNAFLMYDLILHEFLPEIISKQTEFRFPVRTALSEKTNLKLNEATYTLADFNIPFAFEKYTKKKNAKISTNLKWSNYTLDDNDRIRIERYFENLIFLIRMKILLNNGDLDKTKLIWFYPSSMIDVKVGQLESLWKKIFRKYISTLNNPIKLSESVAPFYYLKKRGGISAANLPVASIDIGGGTSDIVIYENDVPTLLTSIRFASNSIFGDAFNGSPANNGFVIKYKDEIDERLNQNDPNLEKVFAEIIEEGKSEDIITFLFSLEDNHLLKRKNVAISFNEKLQFDSDLKIVFIVFFSAIIYHLAKIMKVRNMKAPKFLTFSGTGSKILLVLDQTSHLDIISDLSKIIFEKIYESQIKTIEPVIEANPKEITCKGGLFYDSDTNIESIKNVLLGDGENTLVPQTNVDYVDVQAEKKLDSIVNEVENFIDFVFEINNKLNFSKKFEVNSASLEEYKSILKEDLMMYLKSGLNVKLKELSGNTNINVEEPLFFYPLIGAINKLAYTIVKKENTK